MSLGRLTGALTIWAMTMIAPAGADPIVILIGGNHSDPSPAQLAGKTGRGGNSGLWRMKQDLATHDGLQAEYFNWNGTRAGRIDQPQPAGPAGIVDMIRTRRAQQPEAPLVIVGNSWGGHTAWQVCRLLNGDAVAAENGGQRSIDASSLGGLTISVPTRQVSDAGRTTSVSGDAEEAGGPSSGESPSVTPAHSADDQTSVELVVFLDPSSFGRTTEPKPTVLPDNVREAVNYFTRNTFSWRSWPNEPRLKNIDLGDPASGFLDPGGPKYDSAFNWGAHVAAEWDERIHAQIRQHIRSLAQPEPALDPLSFSGHAHEN